MASQFITLFALVAIAVIAETAVVPGNRLNFLGKFTGPSTRIGSHQSVETSFYFLSQNAAAWSTAQNDCKAFLGETATLLSIDSDEELEEVNRLFQNSDDTGSTYWTGGKYDSAKSTFVWDNSGDEISSNAPWDQGHPNTRTPVTRVYAYTVGGVRLRTDFQTVSLRYVCELAV